MRGRPPIGDADQLRAAMERAVKRSQPGQLVLGKAIFYGPKGGKWADAAHTIPYKEGKGRRKGAKDEPRGRRQSGVQEVSRGRQKGAEEPKKARQKAAPESTAGREKSKPKDNGKRPPGSEAAPAGRGKKEAPAEAKPGATEQAKQAPVPRHWVKGAEFGLQETNKQHKGADGEYTPVRKKLHEEIYAKFLDHVPTVPENQKPTAIVTMGGPAAGKTTLVKHVQSNFNDFAVVNPDDVKEHLPEYDKGINLGEKDGKTVSARDAAFLVHNESSDVAQEIQKLAIEQRKNIILDGTGKNVEKYRQKIKALKDAGYHVQVIMPHVDMNEAIRRVEERAEKTGRYVPEDIVRHAHTRIPSNFEAIARTADDFALFKSGRPPKQVWSGGAGRGDVVHDANYVRDFLRLGKRLSQEVAAGMHKSEDNGGEKKPPSVSLDDLIKRVEGFDAPEEDKSEPIQGGGGDGIWWPIEGYEDEIREKMEKEGGVEKSAQFTVPKKRFLVKARPHKYKSKKWRNGKWVYEYEESAKEHHARVTGRGKRELGPGEEPAGFPWKRYEDRAKRMSNEQLEGAIKDAQATLIHADAMDRETGGDRGGHYRDEISVYRQELSNRAKITEQMGAAKSKSKEARKKGRERARQALLGEDMLPEHVTQVLKERSRATPQDEAISGAIGADRWEGLKLLGYLGANVTAVADPKIMARGFNEELVEYGILTKKEAEKLTDGLHGLMNIHITDAKRAIREYGGSAFSRHKEDKARGEAALEFAGRQFRMAGISKAKAAKLVRQLRNEAYESTPGHRMTMHTVREILGDSMYDTAKYVAVDATYRESGKARSRKPVTNGPIKDNNLARKLYNRGIKIVRKSEPTYVLAKGGPYIGPRGGKWADPQHKIPWKDDSKEAKRAKVEAGFTEWAQRKGLERVPLADGTSLFINHDAGPVPEGAMDKEGYAAGDGPYKSGMALHPAHKDEQSAYVIDDYPYGRDRTKMRVWIETDKKGKQRIARQTQNPKTGRWNNPKKSTYSDSMVGVFDDNGHIKTHGIHIGFDREGQIPNFLKKYGGHMDPKQIAMAAGVHAFDAAKKAGKTHQQAMEMANEVRKKLKPKGEAKPKKKASTRTRYNESLRHESDPAGYSKQLTSDVKRALKKELKVESVKQGYKGSGSQSHRKQLWVRFANGKGIDLFLDGPVVRLGGVAMHGYGKVETTGRSSAAVALEIADKLKPLSEAGEWD